MPSSARVYEHDVAHIGRASIDTTMPALTIGTPLVTVPIWTELLLAKVNVLSVFDNGGDPPVISVGTNAPAYDNIIASILGDSVGATEINSGNLPMITPDLIGDPDASNNAEVDIYVKVTKDGGGAWQAPAGWANVTLVYHPGRGGDGR